MEDKKIIPIDLPRDLYFLMDQLDESIKLQMKAITEKALEQGRWEAAEEYLFDPTDVEFGAYWMYKTKSPLKKAIKGSGVEEHLAPYKNNEFDLTPKGFDCKETLIISAVGDLMFAKYLEQSKDKLYNSVSDLIFTADYTYANLESTISPKKPEGFDIKTKGDTPQINITKNQYDALVKHNDYKYNIVNLANNHILDCGEEGIKVTIKQLGEDNIDYLGVYESEEKSKLVKETKIGNIKIGWISHTFGINGKPIPENKQWLCNITPFHLAENPDLSRIESQIKEAKTANCDLIFLSLHWGLEHEFYPHPDQLEWAHHFAEIGADAIIAHHPHVIQPVEIYTSKNDPSRRIPILYSLGNITPVYSSPATVLSLVARLSLSKGIIDGVSKTIISKLHLTPVAFMCEEENNDKYASVIPLKKLNESSLDNETKDYVDEIGTYADLILGKSWR